MNNIFIKKNGHFIILINNFNKHLSILEILEKNKIFLEFQCRSGYCGTCRVFLLHGIVKYHQKPMAVINNNYEIFPCCCFIFNNSDIFIKIKNYN